MEQHRYEELADFLKTRRNKISPTQVGIPQGNRRRTPGLRREEVAQLAGIGLTWYTWLEQGRPIQVSSQVLESLSKHVRFIKLQMCYNATKNTCRSDRKCQFFQNYKNQLSNYSHRRKKALNKFMKRTCYLKLYY